MIFYPLGLHLEYGFEIPSYNARAAVKRIAQAFVDKQVSAKPATLLQKFPPTVVYSAQVLVLGNTQTTRDLKDILRVNLAACGNIKINDPSIKAWIRMDEDAPDGGNPLFIIRSEKELLEKVDPFFQGFIKTAERK